MQAYIIKNIFRCLTFALVPKLLLQGYYLLPWTLLENLIPIVSLAKPEMMNAPFSVPRCIIPN